MDELRQRDQAVLCSLDSWEVRFVGGTVSDGGQSRCSCNTKCLSNPGGELGS